MLFGTLRCYVSFCIFKQQLNQMLTGKACNIRLYKKLFFDWIPVANDTTFVVGVGFPTSYKAFIEYKSLLVNKFRLLVCFELGHYLLA